MHKENLENITDSIELRDGKFLNAILNRRLPLVSLIFDTLERQTELPERDKNQCNKSENIAVRTKMHVTQTEDVMEAEPTVAEIVDAEEVKEKEASKDSLVTEEK